MKKIFITGGCGYVGSVLTNYLSKKYYIKVIDTQWFGNYIKESRNINIIKKDIRFLDKHFLGNEKFSSFIHLANIANDPSVELDQTLSWEINVLAAKNLIEACIDNGVKNFIYASSGSVYGIKDEEKVTEDLELIPISVYNKTKMICERLLLSYSDKINVFIVRPATVCGISPRMRFDVSVNMLTLQALKNKKITIFGGNQTRPNIHINDMIRVYEHFLETNQQPGIYNAGFENISILDLAKKIQKKINCQIEIKESNDPRSYRQCSDKLLKTGFAQLYSICDAINEISEAFFSGDLVDNESSYTVKWMKERVIKNG